MQDDSSEQDQSSLCVWLVPHIGSESHVLWAWAEDVIFFLPMHDSPRMTAEVRASAERELQRLQLQSEVLHPGEVPLLDADYEQAGDPEDIAGRRLLRERPERLVRGFIRVHRTDTPNQWHYQAANAALVREGLDVETNIDTRNELAMALHRECRRVIVPDGAGLAELNAIATDAVERVSGRPEEQLRKAVEARPFFWWAESVPGRGANQIRWPRALATEIYQRQRRLRPGLPQQLAAVILRSRVEQPEQMDGKLMHRADDGTVRSAGALVRLTQRALESTAPDGVVPLAAYLATVAYEQRRLGLDEADSRRVLIPSLSRDGLRRFGIATEAQLRTCLEWLQAVQLGPGSWPCVTGHGRGEARASTARGGRRAAPGYVVEVGYPLAPFAVSKLKALYEANGWRVPSESSFYAPVLPLELYPGPAPGSYTPTHKRQLDAYCMALPLVLMENREEYAAQGVKLDELRGPLRRVGIYERSHASLVENLCDAWRAEPPPSLPGLGRTAPVLVPVEPDDGHGSGTRYRLGPDFEHADSMIRDAAAFTEQQSTAGRLGAAKKKTRRTE